MRKRIVAVVAALVVTVGAGSALAITYPTPDNNQHPYVGELFFYVPDEVDARFSDPGTWFACSGTLLSPTVVLTAGHCTYAIGKAGASTVAGGGSGGTDVWFSVAEAPDFGFPPSTQYGAGENGKRYAERAAWLDASGSWVRGTATTHPAFSPDAFALADAGMVVLSRPIALATYGRLTTLGRLDDFAQGPKQAQLFTDVGYGLTKVRPTGTEGGDTRNVATVKLNNLKGTFGLPDGVAATFSNDNGKVHTGGTCFGDSGGPVLLQGTNEIVAVASFGQSPNCTGNDGAYRVDQADDRAFILGFLS